MEEIREFCFKEFPAVCLFWNFFVLWSSNNITYHPKEVYAYCGNSFFVRKKEHEKAGVFLETSTKESIIVCDE